MTKATIGRLMAVDDKIAALDFRRMISPFEVKTEPSIGLASPQEEAAANLVDQISCFLRTPLNPTR